MTTFAHGLSTPTKIKPGKYDDKKPLFIRGLIEYTKKYIKAAHANRNKFDSLRKVCLICTFLYLLVIVMVLY